MSRTAVPAFLIGMGLGALIDGIVLHQVLQWHHVVVAISPAGPGAGLERNTFWDGIFHLVAWLIVVVGVLLLAMRPGDLRALGTTRFIGLLMVGLGAFHIVDQVVFHLVLEVHHIRMVENYQLYDWAFFTVGAGFVAAGALLVRRPSELAQR